MEKREGKREEAVYGGLKGFKMFEKKVSFIPIKMMNF